MFPIPGHRALVLQRLAEPEGRRDVAGPRRPAPRRTPLASTSGSPARRPPSVADLGGGPFQSTPSCSRPRQDEPRPPTRFAPRRSRRQRPSSAGGSATTMPPSKRSSRFLPAASPPRGSPVHLLRDTGHLCARVRRLDLEPLAHQHLERLARAASESPSGTMYRRRAMTSISASSLAAAGATRRRCGPRRAARPRAPALRLLRGASSEGRRARRRLAGGRVRAARAERRPLGRAFEAANRRLGGDRRRARARGRSPSTSPSIRLRTSSTATTRQRGESGRALLIRGRSRRRPGAACSSAPCSAGSHHRASRAPPLRPQHRAARPGEETGLDEQRHDLPLEQRAARERSTASRLAPPPRTCATSAASAGRSHASSGSRSGTSERPPRSTKSAASPPSRTTCAPATRRALPPASATAAPRRTAARGSAAASTSGSGSVLARAARAGARPRPAARTARRRAPRRSSRGRQTPSVSSAFSSP